MQLSSHFTKEEFENSDYGHRKNIANIIPNDLLPNAVSTASRMEYVRALLNNQPITVNSCYRNPIINEAIGGSDTSYHLYALAVDFTCASFGTPYEICKAIESSTIQYDQLIYEGSWVHIGFPKPTKKPRMQLLTRSNGKDYSGILK